MITQTKQSVPRFTHQYLWSIASLTILLGGFLLLFPSLIGHLFFNNGESSINFFVRMLGSTLIGYGVMCMLAAKSNNLEACSIAVWSNLSTLLVATIVSLAYRSTYAGYGWLVIGQHVLFAGGFLYCAWQLFTVKHQPDR